MDEVTQGALCCCNLQRTAIGLGRRPKRSAEQQQQQQKKDGPAM